jgi:hypothetical protein
MEFAARSSILCAFHNEAIVRCEMRLLNELRRRADGHARAEIADEACGVDCLVQRVDALTKKD